MERSQESPMLRGLIAFLLLIVAAFVHAQPGEHTLNLKDADIRVFIATVSEITGRSFIVDPRVEGKVNVVSAKPMSESEVYAVFESVLRVNGFAAIPSGSMVKIVPEAIAKQDGELVTTANGPDTLVTRVITLKYVSASELLPILTQLVPQSGQIAPHQASNSLIITDRAGNLARIEQIVRRIDQASDAAVEVIPLQHANASEMARTLALLGEDKPAVPGAAAAKVIADGRTNSLLLSGDRGGRLRLRTMISHLDTPLEASGSTQVIYVRNAKATDLVPILEMTAATLTEQSTNKDAPKLATIQAHEETNALVITADPSVFRALQSVVRQLDVPRAQVLIEAIIAEVSDDLADEIGVQWQVPANGLDDNTFVGGTNFPGPNNTSGITTIAQNPLALGAGLSLGYITGTTKIPGTDKEIINLGFLLRAIKSDGRSNLLSTPSIVTLDNTEAQIKVGQEVPFLTGQYTNTGTGGTSQPTNPFQTIDRKDVGISLTVTPHVNEGDAVRLEIKQEVSSLAQPVQGATDLITNKREISTNVLVQDGQTLVLGGLISEEVRENISKIPALGDIPVVGNLFRYRNSTHTKRNLMVFLRPIILRDGAAEAAVSNEKYTYLRTKQLEARERPGYAKPDLEQPLLPEQAWQIPMVVPPPLPPPIETSDPDGRR
jgi:general secretion pathway protein D